MTQSYFLSIGCTIPGLLHYQFSVHKHLICNLNSFDTLQFHRRLCIQIIMSDLVLFPLPVPFSTRNGNWWKSINHIFCLTASQFLSPAIISQKKGIVSCTYLILFPLPVPLFLGKCSILPREPWQRLHLCEQKENIHMFYLLDRVSGYGKLCNRNVSGIL